MGLLGLLPGKSGKGPVKRKISRSVDPTGVERFFEPDEIIVSKTDLKGTLTYVNEVFLTISDYTEAEVLGAPHSILRHPKMPRCVFKLLWDHLQAGEEIFAYVVNITKFGDHYWVNAHVTPSLDVNGSVIGYHSNRRVPDKRILTEVIQPLYESLLAEEQRHRDRKEGLIASTVMLTKILEEKGVSYDEFILSV